MLAAAHVLADAVGTLDASARVEVRARVTEGAQYQPGYDLVDTESVRTTITDRRWTFTAGYAPTITAPDVEASLEPQFLNTGDLGLSWHDRRLRVYATEAATYGAENSAYLVAPLGGQVGTAATVPTLAQPEELMFGASRSLVGVDVTATRRLSYGGDVGYSLQGGLDAASRSALPFLRAPRADADFVYATSRLDAAETRAYATRSDAVNGPCPAAIVATPTSTAAATCAASTEIAQVVEAWRRRLSRVDTLALGAGVAAAETRLHPDDAWSGFVYPVATLTYEHAIHVGRAGDVALLRAAPGPARATFHFDAQLAPVVDGLSGALDYRAQGTLSLVVPWRRSTFHATAFGARSVSSREVEPLTLYVLDAGVDQRIAAALSVGVDVRYGWQSQENVASFFSEMVILQATARLPTARF